ncbi:putative Importin subunit beta-1 [Blattamonas nauphoetae]|uniref:Importin subunit beta-1 n=1 Tax=Blattamonas nauphoetae TaxID=2049346 RepID=A0ABQ9YFS1_9EUKA|nr:putative Importin subunit beta-1 [Blattamonas nauphoetae]
MNYVAEANALLDHYEATDFSPSRQIELADRWLKTFDINARNVMKGALINTLATASRGIARSAARVASLIAVIEIPCGQWDDFFTIMEGNLRDQPNPNVYHAFLTCLGYTCQDLDKSVQIEDPSVIRRSVYPFLDPARGLELNEVAINALNNSIEFCQRTFTNTEERNTLVNLMINSCVSPSEQVRAHAYECLIKAFSLFYPLLDTNNFFQLFDMTVNNLSMVNPINKPQREVDYLIPSLLEIWIVIAEVENTIQTTEWYPPRTLRHSFSSDQLTQFTINRPPVIFHSVCQQIFQPLFPLLCLILQSKPDDYDTPSWDKFHSTVFLMQMFVKVKGDEVANQIVNFVNEHIESDDWHMKDTMLQLLGCIFVGTTRDRVIVTITNKLMYVFQMQTDPSLIVRDTAAWLLNKIVGNLPEVVDKIFPQFLGIIMQGLELHNSPFIRGQITMAFKSIVKNNLENQNCLAMLVADFPKFNNLIVQNVINAPNQMFLDKVLSMNQDLMFSIPRQQETMLLSVGTAMMKNIENNLGNLSPVFLVALLSLLADFSIPLGEKFNVFSASFVKVLQFVEIPDSSVIELILDFLQVLAVNLKSSFSQHYDTIFPFVLNCFKPSVNVKAVKVKVTLLVGDIATGITPQFVDRFIEFIPPVLSLLDRVDEYGLEVIDNVLSTLSLIALQVQDKFEDFLEPTLNNVSNACLKHVSENIRVGMQRGSIVGMEEKLREVQHLHESALESFSYLIAAFSWERSPKCRRIMMNQAYTICSAVSVCLLEGLSPIISPSGELFESIGKINATQFDFVQYPVLERSGVRTLTDLLKSGIVTQNTLVLAILVLVDIFVLLRQDDPRCVVSGVPLEFVYLCRNALNSGIFPQDVIRHIHEGIDSMLQFLQRQKGF